MARLSSGALHRHDLSVAVPFGVQARVAAQGNDGLTTPSPRGACLVIRRALLGAVACRAPPPTYCRFPFAPQSSSTGAPLTLFLRPAWIFVPRDFLLEQKGVNAKTPSTLR